MYETYKEHAEFFVIYIREAHPSDLWQLPVNIKDEVVYKSPETQEERTELAQVCLIKLDIKFPALVDGFDDATDNQYTGWPDRLYVIDREGKVAYKSRPGPFGFKPREAENVLKQIVPPPDPGKSSE